MDPIGILVAVVVGAIIGAIANFLVPNRVANGFIGAAISGIVGSFLGNWIWNNFNLPGREIGFAGYALIPSIVGAIIFGLIASALMGGSRRRA